MTRTNSLIKKLSKDGTEYTVVDVKDGGLVAVSLTLTNSNLDQPLR